MFRSLTLRDHNRCHTSTYTIIHGYGTYQFGWSPSDKISSFRNTYTYIYTYTYIIYNKIGTYRVIKKSLCTWRLQLSQHTSFLPQYLAQSDCLAADRQGQGDTRLTLTPSFIPNSNYVIMVSDWNCLKYFCVFMYCNHQVHRDFLITLYIYIYIYLPIFFLVIFYCWFLNNEVKEGCTSGLKNDGKQLLDCIKSVVV
jgi:hypothetical protein